MNRRTALTLLAAGAALAGCGQGGGPQSAGPRGPGVLGVAGANGLGRFVRAADSAGLTEVLAASGPFTLFAPTDRAFAASAAGRLDGEALQRLIAYHVVPGQLTSDFLEGMDVNHTTLLGSSLNVDGTGTGLRVNGAAVVRADLLASNGVVFAIDRVLTPR
ncbi:MAG: fasciclin domain-containing protein [Rhodobacteraceae bacterium]|nr:fasciclin domain-containing protein [Paracoccaceae bacterium]